MAFENGIVAELGRIEEEEIEWRRANAVMGANLTETRSVSGLPRTRSFDRRSLLFFVIVLAIQVVYFAIRCRVAYRSGTKLETLRQRFAAQQERLKAPTNEPLSLRAKTRPRARLDKPTGRKSEVEAFHRKLARKQKNHADAVAAAGIYSPYGAPSFHWARSSLAVNASDPAYLSATSATTTSASQIPVPEDSIV